MNEKKKRYENTVQSLNNKIREPKKFHIIIFFYKFDFSRFGITIS
jgi:hypothetical protein